MSHSLLFSLRNYNDFCDLGMRTRPRFTPTLLTFIVKMMISAMCAVLSCPQETATDIHIQTPLDAILYWSVVAGRGIVITHIM